MDFSFQILYEKPQTPLYFAYIAKLNIVLIYGAKNKKFIYVGQDCSEFSCFKKYFKSRDLTGTL